MITVELNNQNRVVSVWGPGLSPTDIPLPGHTRQQLPDDAQVQCGWTYVDGVWAESAELVAARTRMVWPNASTFLAEFTMAELAAVQLSTDPTLAALRLILAAWVGEVHSDDPRVQAGVAVIVGLEIITQERADAILTKH